MLSAVIFFMVIAASPFSWAQTKIRVNWGAVSGAMSGLWVTYEEGLFKKNEIGRAHV